MWVAITVLTTRIYLNICEVIRGDEQITCVGRTITFAKSHTVQASLLLVNRRGNLLKVLTGPCIFESSRIVGSQPITNFVYEWIHEQSSLMSIQNVIQMYKYHDSIAMNNYKCKLINPGMQCLPCSFPLVHPLRIRCLRKWLASVYMKVKICASPSRNSSIMSFGPKEASHVTH